MEKQKYSFATVISMVVGIVIGSGIFFKADDILVAVNGDVGLGLLGFLIVGVGVLFGALTVSYYALHDREHIGMIGYSKMALGKKFAFLVGWFSIVCYFPALIVILAMLVAIYLSILLGISSPLFITITTAVALIASFTINIKSPNFGGKIQVVFTIAKIIPLVVIGLVGALFFNEPATTDVVASPVTGGAPLSALIAIAFAFDGWIVATNISSELKNSKKDLPKALALGSIGILAIYCLYFYGITRIIEPAQIVALGDAHTELAANAILGTAGSKVITLFVVISVYGGLNGMTLAFLRLPKLLLDANLIKNVFGDEETQQEVRIILFCLVPIVFYFVFQQLVDYGLIFSNLKYGFDISSLPIMINYLIYIVVFLSVNRLAAKESTKTRIYYLVISLIATITAIVVIYGAMSVNGILYITFSIILSIIGIPFYNKEH